MIRTPRPGLCLGLAVAALLCTAAVASSPEWETPPVSHKDVRPYFDDSAIRSLVLPPPPAQGSAIDADDVAGVMQRQQVVGPRRAEAEEDAHYLYDRFAAVVGFPIRRDRFPALVNLLNRAEKQVSGPVFAMKKDYPRARPYQRLTLSHVCGRDAGPPKDADTGKRTSYPSGHSAYGWTAALVLARVMPDKAAAILARGRDYGESRVICAMHFPSDVAAGEMIATAVVAHLDRTPEFQRDLARARAEVAKAEARR